MLKRRRVSSINVCLKFGVDDTTAGGYLYLCWWPSALQLVRFKLNIKSTLAQSAECYSHFNHATFKDYLVSIRPARQRDPTILDAVFGARSFQWRISLRAYSVKTRMIESASADLAYSSEGRERTGTDSTIVCSVGLPHERQARIPQQEAELHKEILHFKRGSNRKRLIKHCDMHNDAESRRSFKSQDFEHGLTRCSTRVRLSSLEIAIKQLTTDQLYSEPSYAMLRAWLAQSQHRYDQVRHSFRRSEA